MLPMHAARTCAPHQGGQLVMPGFQTVLKRIAQLWGTKEEDLRAQVGWAEARAGGGQLRGQAAVLHV